MTKPYTDAPMVLRALYRKAAVLLAVMVVFQLYMAFQIYLEISAAMASYDPFSDPPPAIVHPPVVEFINGLVMSLPATMAGFTLVAALRLLRPYRPRSRNTALVAIVAQVVLIAAALVGVLIGNRSIGPAIAGQVLSLVFTLPLVPGIRHAVTKAWSVPVPVPRPVLPPDTL